MGKDELTGAEEAFTQDGSNLAAGAYQFGQVNVTFNELQRHCSLISPSIPLL